MKKGKMFLPIVLFLLIGMSFSLIGSAAYPIEEYGSIGIPLMDPTEDSCGALNTRMGYLYIYVKVKYDSATTSIELQKLKIYVSHNDACGSSSGAIQLVQVKFKDTDLDLPYWSSQTHWDSGVSTWLDVTNSQFRSKTWYPYKNVWDSTGTLGQYYIAGTLNEKVAADGLYIWVMGTLWPGNEGGNVWDFAIAWNFKWGMTGGPDCGSSDALCRVHYRGLAIS